ncbi:heavy-metal-associated domain-containing protein [Brachybacterium timonense]|uniref:heavy-metal-associated domain-containing protein n=1 Tax=Brachybacterium timonense TaxID=2050896 RepID=UPI000D0B5DCA|nr:heavy metal-associated domain-containing protein [Brachybacterium timonense]
MSTSTYVLSGLTCEHCVKAVSEEVSALDGVTEATVDLVAGGESTLTVTADRELSDDEVREALEEAGEYQLVGRG